MFALVPKLIVLAIVVLEIAGVVALRAYAIREKRNRNRIDRMFAARMWWGASAVPAER
jgi:Tfp pilus assembly protein PilX